MLRADRKRALDELYRMEAPALLRYLRAKLPVRADAEEVLQEAYLRLCKTETISEIRNLRGFLYRVATNVVIDRYRAMRKGRIESIEDLAPDVPLQLESEDPSPEQCAIASELLAALQSVIEGLPPRCRQVFLMHRIGLKTHREIARELGISTQMVEKHIAKAMLRCTERLRAFR